MRHLRVIEKSWNDLPPVFQYWIVLKVLLMTTPKQLIAGIIGMGLFATDLVLLESQFLLLINCLYVSWCILLVAKQ